MCATVVKRVVSQIAEPLFESFAKPTFRIYDYVYPTYLPTLPYLTLYLALPYPTYLP